MKMGISKKIMIVTIASIIVIIVAAFCIPKNQEMLKIKHPTQIKK